MWKFTAEYEDFDGNNRKKELLFNLTKAELRELNYSVNGGIDKYYQDIVDSKNSKELYSAFSNIVKLAYGEKSLDGENFDKSEEIYARFKSSMAYDVFMDYLLETEDGAIKFVNGVIPAKLREELKKDN